MRKSHPDKNIITRAIGAKDSVEVDFYEHRLKKGDIILMCTDGLSNMVEDEELFHIVQGGRRYCGIRTVSGRNGKRERRYG